MKSLRISFPVRKSAKTLLGIALAASTGCSTGPDPRTPERIATIQDATMQLWIETPNGAGMGSAVALSPQHLITCRHGWPAKDVLISEIRLRNVRWDENIITLYEVMTEEGLKRWPIPGLPFTAEAVLQGTGKVIPASHEVGEDQTHDLETFLKDCIPDWIVLECEDVPAARTPFTPLPIGEPQPGKTALIGGYTFDERSYDEGTRDLRSGAAPEFRLSWAEIEEVTDDGAIIMHLKSNIQEPLPGMSGGPIFMIDGEELLLVGTYLADFETTWNDLITLEKIAIGRRIPIDAIEELDLSVRPTSDSAVDISDQ